MFRDVAALSLPAGPWWITASATVSRKNPRGDVTCRLQTPVDFDETTSTIPDPYRTAPMNLQVTHNYDAVGGVTLQCKSDVNPVVSNVRIVAVQAGHLVNRQMGGGESTSGSGYPLIISGFRDNGGAFAGTPATLGALTLPAGSWLLSAKLYLDIGGSQGMDALCKLSAAGPAIDQVNLVLDKYQRAIVSLEGAHSFGAGGGTVRVTCQSVPDYLIIHAYWIKLTAIKASSLTQRVL